MAYKNSDAQLASARRHYRANAKVYIARNEVRKKARKEWVDSFKKVPCADCGVQYPPRAMDFHHVTGTKEFDVAAGVRLGYGKARMLAEIAKCIILCAVCHRLRDD